MYIIFETFSVVNAKLKDIHLTYAALDGIFEEYKPLFASLIYHDAYRHCYEILSAELPVISKNVRQMKRKGGSILKKDVAFLLVRNALIRQIDTLLNIAHFSNLPSEQLHLANNKNKNSQLLFTSQEPTLKLHS